MLRHQASSAGGKRKIVFFLPNSVGGAERMTITIAKFLDTENFDVQFVVVGRSADKILPFIPDCYKTSLLYLYKIYDFATVKLVRYLRRERPVAVFCSLHYLNIRVILASKIAGGIKTVVRSNMTLAIYSKFFNLVARRVYPMADIIVAQTEEMSAELIDRLCVDAQKVRILHNYVDTQYIDQKISGATSPYTCPGPNIVSVLRFSAQKGLDILIDAFDRFSSSERNAHLYLIGDCNVGSEVLISTKSQVEKCGLSQNVHFIGLTQNPYQWIKFADCFVLPSRHEGLPNSLLEALYLKTPVVATVSVPIIGRIVENGVNGYTVPVDDASAMASAMAKAVNIQSKGLSLYQSASAEQFRQLFG